MSDSYEAIIVGGAAAGLSAALVLGRSCRRTLVVDDGRPRNAVAAHMHGLISRDGTPPLELLAIAREQLRRYGCVEQLQAHVDAISGKAGDFKIRTESGATYRARRVLLAIGVVDALPAIEGLGEAWGHTAFVCPYCDGWEMRDKRIAVIGPGTKAVELAQELRQWSDDLIVCTHGDGSLSADARAWLQATGTTAYCARVRRIDAPGGKVASIEFDDDAQADCEAVFVSAPLRPRHPLVDMLGCRLRDDGEIDTDNRGHTSVPGVYAAGDIATTVHQVVLAAASGVCAAMAINEDLIKDDVRELLTGV